MSSHTKRIHTLLLLLFGTLAMLAQPFDNSRRVDTLSFAERFSMRTNITDWAVTIPNVGFEYSLRRENWSRYAVNLNLRCRPGTSGTFVRPFVFEVFEAAIEGRQYWHERKATGSGYLKHHRYLWDKLFSQRTMLPKHPRWVFYRGIYLSYTDYSWLFRGHGRKGTAYMAGFTWGFVKPFVAFQNGTSIDMEFGISAGLAYGKYNRYTLEYASNSYPSRGSEGWALVKHPVVRDIHAALVYRPGHYPIQKKYRWRYDVDMAYHERRDSIYSAWRLRNETNYVRDSIYAVVSADFRQLYDSCVAERHRQDQEYIDSRAPQRNVKEGGAVTKGSKGKK